MIREAQKNKIETKISEKKISLNGSLEIAK
jgi:hypothetical protein